MAGCAAATRAPAAARLAPARAGGRAGAGAAARGGRRAPRRARARAAERQGAGVATSTAVPDDTTVCDDFECTSSPAVGVAIKAIAQQVDGPVREGCSGAAWAAGIELVDKGAAGARICTRERVDKYEPLKEALAEGATGEVLSMDMDGMDTLLLRWRLRGTPQLAALGDIDAVVTWKVTFNLISGRATQLEISYDYGETPKPAALYFTAQRTLAAAPLRGDPSEDASKEEDSGINVNPADPGRWMQQQNQEDQFQKEAIDLALALAVLYALVQALKTVL